MATTKQLEKKVDTTRGRIEDTLAELRDRLSPPSLIDEALGYAKDNGGADFVRNLGRQVADNPLPVALMGAGLAWLMVAQNRSANGAGSDAGRLEQSIQRTKAMSNYEQPGRSKSTMSDGSDSSGMTEKAKEMLSKASDTMGGMRDRASDAMGGMRDRASDAMGRASGTMSRSMSSAMDTVSSAMPDTRGLAKFVQDEPMVLAGVGVALGAIIGALLPTTEMEERYIGPTAEQLKEQAKTMAREQWERGKEMAAGGWEEAKDTAMRTWEDAKDEAQQGWENTQQKMDSGSSQPTLVPSGSEGSAGRLADATSRSDSRG